MPLTRIIMHWSAGGHKASDLDRKHYHEIVEGDGDRIEGDKLPEANSSTKDGHYAAHTRRLNTGSIGLAVAAMSGAKERPFRKGKFAITEKQLDVFCEMVAEYADTYGIEVRRDTVLTHAEVQTTLSVAQNGKWDISWLPDMAKPGNPIEVGDRLRDMVRDKQKKLGLGSGRGLPTLSGDEFEDRIAGVLSKLLRS
ncbi:MAG: peptidoglycan-binding protein [Pseudomonadota bacterium]